MIICDQIASNEIKWEKIRYVNIVICALKMFLFKWGLYQQADREHGGHWGFLTGHLENRVIPVTWMTLVDPKDDILKVLCHYICCWLRYMNFMYAKKMWQTELQTNIRQTLEELNAEVCILLLDGNVCITKGGLYKF